MVSLGHMLTDVFHTCSTIIDTPGEVRFLPFFMNLTMSTQRVRQVGRGCIVIISLLHLFRGLCCFVLNLYFSLWVFKMADSLLLSFYNLEILNKQIFYVSYCLKLCVSLKICKFHFINRIKRLLLHYHCC